MPLDQLRGTVGNVRQTIGDVDALDIAPPFIADSAIWIRYTVPRGLGFSDRAGHLTAIIPLTIVMVVASLATLTYVAAAYLLIMAPIALLRFVPAVERRWPFTAADWPLWEVRATGFGGA